jgi:hypothetical protein
MNSTSVFPAIAKRRNGVIEVEKTVVHGRSMHDVKKTVRV